jgi:rhamnopyranosyl-N-acetylglucosaminyl-diphospho-decaprenol beta-1,3/1,4-galactofuranosyltransferase
MEKIIAVVVSCNRYQQLKNCVEAIRNQTVQPHAILVVNNGSSDYTSVWLDKQSDIIHLYQENQGSAGGYHSGIERAYAMGYDWIWCMDDDGYPKEDALEILMSHAHSRDTLYNSILVDHEDKKTFNWKLLHYETIDDIKTDVIEGVCHPFNGALIHSNIVMKAGLPESKLFYWGEGSAYFYRLTKQHQIQVKTITKSIHYHPTDRIELKKEWEYKDGWKMYYYVRNRYVVLKEKYTYTLFALIAYLAFIPAFCATVLIYQKKQKTRKLWFVLWPVMDALMGNYQSHSNHIHSRMTEQSQRKILAFFLEPLKRGLLQLFVPSMSESKESFSV